MYTRPSVPTHCPLNVLLFIQALWDDVEEVFDRDAGRCHEVPRVKGLLEDPRDRIIEAYMSELSQDLCTRREETAKSGFKVVYTAMHGVGLPFASALMTRFGFSRGLIPGKTMNSSLGALFW